MRRKGEMGTREDELCGVIQRSEAGGPLVTIAREGDW
jgi:hypothetical protein